MSKWKSEKFDEVIPRHDSQQDLIYPICFIRSVGAKSFINMIISSTDPIHSYTCIKITYLIRFLGFKRNTQSSF